MLSSKRFLLKAPILGVQTVGGYREAVRVPEGAMIEIISGLPTDENDKRFVEVLWNGQSMVIFAEHFRNRAEEIH
jgi:hypothetical protein